MEMKAMQPRAKCGHQFVLYKFRKSAIGISGAVPAHGSLEMQIGYGIKVPQHSRQKRFQRGPQNMVPGV